MGETAERNRELYPQQQGGSLPHSIAHTGTQATPQAQPGAKHNSQFACVSLKPGLWAWSWCQVRAWETQSARGMGKLCCRGHRL